MKKILKRILLVLLILLVLAQIPFIYRRYQTGKLAEKIAQFDAQRTTYQDPNFKEYKGIIHAHTNLGGHSTGSFGELIAAANSNDLDFVLMTEHVSDSVDTSAQTLNGVFGKTLFVGGNEMNTADGDRFLLIPGSPLASAFRVLPTESFLNVAHHEGRIAIVTYPEKYKSWDSIRDFNGVEVFSLHTAAKQMNWLTALGDLLWSYPSYPELMLAKNFQRPDANLAKFDEIASQRKISLFAGTDAHSNIGFHLFGDDAGNKLINIKLDPYETIFKIARIHVQMVSAQPLDRESLLFAVKKGHSFVGIDALGDTSGFAFGTKGPVFTVTMGDEIDRGSASSLGLKAISPLPARIVFLKDGQIFHQTQNTTEVAINPSEPGAYRVEVYRDDLGPPFDKMPWIMSNPIYVR